MNANYQKHAWRAVLYGGLALLLGIGGANSAEAATLRLITLRCYDTQDVLPPLDECRLKISGGWRTQLDHVMAGGQSWAIDAEHQVQAPVTIRLLERDNDGAVDLLGEVVIPPVPTNGFNTALFNHNGALYKLLYRVVP